MRQTEQNGRADVEMELPRHLLASTHFQGRKMSTITIPHLGWHVKWVNLKYLETTTLAVEYSVDPRSRKHLRVSFQLPGLIAGNAYSHLINVDNVLTIGFSIPCRFESADSSKYPSVLWNQNPNFAVCYGVYASR